MSGSERDTPSFGTTIAHTVSPHCWSGTPMIVASRRPVCSDRAFSISAG